RLPQARRGSVVDQLALNIDLAPTLLEFAGLEPSESMQGQSVLPLVVNGQVANWRTDFFYEHHFGENRQPPIPATEGVREARWKYTRWTGTNPVFEELFDLETDPQELHNLAKDESQQSQLERLRKRWTRLANDLN
ncbi:MAG TPA: sulfatase/phosphatase domain-containing protein, partial [Chthoniobacteraceae bacterium]|nr:sulfatase/phosphatase domain-containing protein [Chthoniobacteraceae bacterium]